MILVAILHFVDVLLLHSKIAAWLISRDELKFYVTYFQCVQGELV